MKLQETKTTLLSLGIAFIVALAMYPTKAHAQIMGKLEVDVPFEFHVGNSKLPAGKYVIHTLDDSNLTVMEIRSADGSTSVLFDVQSVQANSIPAKNELIFNKYGKRYFLAKLFDEGNRNGDQVVESGYEKRIGQTADAQEHVPASPRG
jgi:hypothetical protein